ncbi:bifunctional metallophosphatase/5'-nucleotidase [Alienimonas californiensis]|uniref:Trifunctional nucleotide phosphoesterase protein YfkN n=1 Tax=Alienimonas californiensis TaxID=2527989 RepID=A0A517PBC0_9PLAN|nr:bifunctional metallophosphatase/5'-nucleotidase [Alienimonas californiensis]QDT16675.1 Trifunctional nucleotide phosphoesterase protein YfkN precursor [Alienimonas californiensis]
MAPILFVAPAAPAADAERDSDRVRTLSIAYVNDIHAQLEPHPELFWNERTDERVRGAGGLSRIKTAFGRLAETRPHLLRIDGGDTFQGSGPGAWTEGGVMVRPMNALGIDYAIPGNWAVAYGADRLVELSEQLNYPLLSANIYDAATGELAFEPYRVQEINGVRVGLIGFTDPDVPTRQPPYMSRGLSFRGEEVLQPAIDKLNSGEGVEGGPVDVLVLVTHIGLMKSVELAETLRGVDVLLSSDTHERTYEPIVRGETWVVEAGAFGSLMGVLDLSVRDGKIVDRRWELLELRAENYPEDPEVKAIVEEELAPHRDRMDREIGRTGVWLERYNVMSSPLDRMIADAIREEADAEIGLSNGYRFAPPTAPGPVTEGDLWNWLPTPLPLKLGGATGAQLKAYWESEFENVFSADPDRLFGGWLARPSTNVHVDFNSTGPAGERLIGIAVDGEPLEEDRVYKIAAGARDGQPEDQIHRVKQCRNVRIEDATTHDAVRNLLKRSSPVTETGEPPLHCVIRPDVLRSQFLNPKFRALADGEQGPEQNAPR